MGATMLIQARLAKTGFFLIRGQGAQDCGPRPLKFESTRGGMMLAPH